MKTIPQISKTTLVLIIFISTAFILTSFALNIPYRKALFRYSLDLMHKMQQQTLSPFLNGVNNLITFYAGTQGTLVLVVLIYILSYDKINVIVIIVYICANTYLMAFIKVGFSDPRPYIYSDKVRNLQWKCQITYGFPSGHTWILLLLHEPFVTDIIGCGPYKLGFLYSILLAGLVPWSRMYLGSHSVDQLVNGLLYSVGFLVLYRYFFRQKLFKIIGILLDQTKRIRNLMVLIVIHIFFIVPPIILYEINANYRDVDMWQFHKTNQVCGKSLNYLHKMGAQTSDIAIFNIITGFSYGFLLLLNKQYGNEDNKIKTVDFLLGFWEFRVSKIRNFLIKKFLLYSMSVFLTPCLIYLLIGVFIKDFYITYFLKVIAWNVMAIIWIRLIPQISTRYKLIQATSYQKTSMVDTHH